jgi:hypothetical protein
VSLKSSLAKFLVYTGSRPDDVFTATTQFVVINFNCVIFVFVRPTEGATYSFGFGDVMRTSGGGVVSFAFPIRDLPDSRIDRAAFGLTTDVENTRAAVTTIFRVSSGSSSDFIELQLVGLVIDHAHNHARWIFHA